MKTSSSKKNYSCKVFDAYRFFFHSQKKLLLHVNENACEHHTNYNSLKKMTREK